MIPRFFPILLASCLQLSGSVVLYIQGNETSFDFHFGVTSEIKFYVNDENHDDKELRIIVSHQPEDTKTSHMKCILTQSATGCNTTSDICFCPAVNSSRNVFSLKKTFLQTDSGVWKFQSISHHNQSKTVKVKVHGECLSLDIQNELQMFTFREGLTSEIIFHVNNITDVITLYVFKDGHSKSSSCKLLLTQRTCVTHVGSCQCAATSNKGRVEFTFRKQFRVQDSGVWVFEVWSTNISKHVNINVQGNTTDTSTENASETTKNSEDKLHPRSDFVLIVIIVIAALIIVIAVSSIIAVLCGPRFLMRNVCRLFMKSRGQFPVSSAQSSQSFVSRDRPPTDEDVFQQDSDDAKSSRDGSLRCKENEEDLIHFLLTLTHETHPHPRTEQHRVAPT